MFSFFAKKSLPAAVLSAGALSGCLSYSPQELGGLSDYQLCKLNTVQRVNIAEASKRSLAGELDRRKEDCRTHHAAIKAQLDEDLYDRTYRNQSP